VSPASDRPVPLDLSGAISEPMPIPGTFGQHAQGQALEQPPALPPGVPHHLRPSDDGSEPVPCPPGKTMHSILLDHWAAWCNAWLLIKLTPKGVVFYFLFLRIMQHAQVARDTHSQRSQMPRSQGQ